MLLLALALAPGIAIMFFIYSKDKYDREPFWHLFISFLLGALSTLPAIILESKLEPWVENLLPGKTILYYAVFAFAVVGFSEELCKFTMLRLYAFRKKEFNEPFDGIIYSVVVSMGFATLENIAYVYAGGYSTALIRMFLSVPAHATFGVIMGYYAGLAKFNKERSFILLIKGLLLATFFHGAYDFFLFLQQSDEVNIYVSDSLLFFGALTSFWIALRLSFRSIKLHQALSLEHHNKRNSSS